VKVSTKNMENVLSRTDISSYLEQYLNGKELVEKLLHFISHKSKSKSLESSNAMGLEILSQLRDQVQQSLPAIETEYIALTKQCNILLQRIKDRIEEEAAENEQKLEFPRSSSPAQTNLMMMLHIFRSTFGWESLEGGTLFSESSSTSTGLQEQRSQLLISAKALEGFIAELKEVAPVEPLGPVRVVRQDDSCIVPIRAEQRAMDKIRDELGTGGALLFSLCCCCTSI
jgi:hypothetical protein